MPVLPILKRLKSAFQDGPSTRLSRGGMPDGFFFSNVLWFGDAGSKRVAVARGLTVEPDQLDALDEPFQAHLCERLRQLIASLGQEYTLQVRQVSGGDYSDVLDPYGQETQTIPSRHRWVRWNRSERHARYVQAMRDGKLQRQTLTLFFSRVIDATPPFALRDESLSRHYVALSNREALSFEGVQFALVRSLFPDCRVTPMGDAEHFRYLYRFFNPNVGPTIPLEVERAYDPSLSIQANCLFSDLVQPAIPHVSFSLEGHHHAVIVMRELPRSSGPGIIAKLLNLGFSDVELSLNLYPQNLNRTIDRMGELEERLQGEAVTNHKRTTVMSVQKGMASTRVQELESGDAIPVNLFFGVRLWAKDPDALATRIALVKNAFLGMSGASVYVATNPETARKLFYQTFPGWTDGTYRGYDLETNDAVAADLIPWSATFTGRLNGAEALYDSPRGGLVGLSTHVHRTPQHFLIAGATGAGKSILITDFLAQAAHRFGYILIVDEGMSHVTSAQALGADPIVLSPNGNVTLNYLDPDGVPLSSGSLSGASGLLVQMLGETGGDKSRVSELRGVLLENLQALYRAAWDDHARCYPEHGNQAARRALAARLHLEKRMRAGDGDTFLDAWVDLRDRETSGDSLGSLWRELDEGDVARFAASCPLTVRDVGLSLLSREQAPTHAQLVDLLVYAPAGSGSDADASRKLGKRLAAWKHDGLYGRLFDGPTTHRLDADVTLFELSKIDRSLEELKSAAHYLILNVSRNQIVRRPRAQRKLVLFEEGARVLAADGGALIEEYYTQMRKYGCVTGLVLQQIGAFNAVRDSVRASVLGNTKLFLVSAQPTAEAAAAVAEALTLSDESRSAIQAYPSVEHQVGKTKHSSFLMVAPQPSRKLVGTFWNVASPEIVYAGSSDGEVYDSRAQALRAYPDPVTGILAEAQKTDPTTAP